MDTTEPQWTEAPGDDRPPFDIHAIERPHPNLLKQYAISSLAALIFAPIVFLPMFFKYYTLRYAFDEEGVSARWGILFRREIYLTYKRIQDIHVKRNVIERWLDIGTVEVQTASGSSSAELSIEGMEHHAEVRDYLYGRMRGFAPSAAVRSSAPTGAAPVPASGTGEAEVVALLGEIRGELEGVRRELANRG